MLYHFIILLLFIHCSHAYGQVQSSEENNVMHNIVLNKNTTSKAEDDIEVIEVNGYVDMPTANYQVIQRKDFIRGSQTLSDVLKTVNGIQIRQISGIGNPTSVSIRGSSGKQVQFYIGYHVASRQRFFAGLHSMYGMASLLAPTIMSIVFHFNFSWQNYLLLIASLPFIVFILGD